jgi:hypothetical protein
MFPEKRLLYGPPQRVCLVQQSVQPHFLLVVSKFIIRYEQFPGLHISTRLDAMETKVIHQNQREKLSRWGLTLPLPPILLTK